MEKIISNENLLNVIVKSQKKNQDLYNFKEDIIDGINYLNTSGNEVVDIDIIRKNEDKWNVIVTLDNDEDVLYTLNLTEIINI